MTHTNLKIQNPTIEMVAYGSIFLITLITRFLLLGQIPLNDSEASIALQARNLADGLQTSHLSGQPGYLGFTTLLFYAFNASGFWARFLPALLGSVIVLLPMQFRKQVGPIPALICATLISVDPLLTATSRMAGGAFLAMVGLVAGFGWYQLRRPVLSGISLGIALLGGVELWAGLVGVGLAWFVSRSRLVNQYEEDKKFAMRPFLISMGATVVIISTLFLIVPRGFSTLGSGLVEYYLSWGVEEKTPFIAVLIAWTTSQLFLIVFGSWGFISGIRQHKPFIGFLGYWTAISLLIAFANPSRSVNDLIWVSIPLGTLTALKLADMIENWVIDNKVVFFSETGLVFALVGFSFINFLNLAKSPEVTPELLQGRIIGTILPIVLIMLLTVLLAWGWSAASSRKGLVLGFGILCLVVTLGSTWKAAGLGSYPENEVWSGSSFPVGSEHLTNTIADLSRWNHGWVGLIDIQVINLDIPSLQWALGEYKETSLETAFNPNVSPSVAITRVESELLARSVYRGQQLTWSTHPDFGTMTLQDWVLWVLQRKAPQVKTDVILWARNDLFSGGE